MSSTFGAPVYDNNDAAAATPDDAQASATFDLDDPQLASEVLTEAVDKDAYAVPPPMSDGKWRAKLKIVPIKDPKDGTQKQAIAVSNPKMANGKMFIAVNVEASVIDLTGKYDGTKLTEYWVKSLIDGKKGVSQMSTIAAKAGSPAPAQSNDRDRYAHLAKVLAGEPEVIIDTVWEARCQHCEEVADRKGERKPNAILRGMQRFPQLRDGTRDPNITCPNCKSMVRAQVRLAQFFSVKEAKATQGIGAAAIPAAAQAPATA